MKKIIFLLIMAVPPSVGVACGNFLVEWVHCQKDSDCMVAEDQCPGWWKAINKNFLTSVEAYNQCKRPMIDCAPYRGPEKSKLFAVCKAGKCDFKPVPGPIAPGLQSFKKECGPSPLDCASGQFCNSVTGRWHCTQ